MSAIGKMSEKKAMEFVQKGEKALGKWSFFGSTAKFEEAAEFFEKAATQYKMAKNYKEAAAFYLKAAGLSEKCKNTHEATSQINQAADMYKKDASPDEAIPLYERVIEMHMESNRFSTAAKLYKAIAELAEKGDNLTKAVEAYSSAAELYQAENSITTGNQLLLEVARIRAELAEYDAAVEIYENVARQALDSKLTKWSVKEYYFKALLCHLCRDSASSNHDIKRSEDALEKYRDMDPSFANTRECTFIDNIIQAYNSNDIPGFADVVFEWDNISKLDDWATTRLFEIKKCLQSLVDCGDEDVTGFDDDLC